MADAADPLIGSQFGSYVVEDFIGAGGMGRVYKGRHHLLGRIVALKVLPVQMGADPDTIQRFLREAKLTSGLQHPNLVQVFDFGDSDYGNYIALEFVEGMSLSQILKAEGRLNPTQVLEVAHQALSALEHAHGAGIIHRDIKPDNMLVAQDGTLKITDLGLAKDHLAKEDSSLTVSGTVMGTPFYMAPEQVRGDRDIDGRADLYALGATLYHCATGQPPFTGSSSAMIMNKHLTDPTPNPQGLAPDLPESTTHFIMRLMHKDPNYRFHDAHEALEAVQILLHAAPGKGQPNQTVVIYDETSEDGNAKQYKIGVAVVLLVFGIGFGIWKWGMQPPSTVSQNTISQTPVSLPPSPRIEKPGLPKVKVSQAVPTPQPGEAPVPIPVAKPPERSLPATPAPAPTPRMGYLTYTWRNPNSVETSVFKGEPGQVVEIISSDVLDLSREQNIFIRFPIMEICQELETNLAQKPEIRRVDMILAGKITTSNPNVTIKVNRLSQNLKETFSIAPSSPLLKPVPPSPKEGSVPLGFNITDDVKAMVKSGENFGWVLRLNGDGQVQIGSCQDPNETASPTLRFELGYREDQIPAETKAKMTKH